MPSQLGQSWRRPDDDATGHGSGAGDDATKGDGVYFTSIPPWAESDVLLDNNFDGASRRFNKRTEAYIRIEAWMLSPEVDVVRANVRQNGKGPMKGKVRDV